MELVIRLVLKKLNYDIPYYDTDMWKYIIELISYAVEYYDGTRFQQELKLINMMLVVLQLK